MTEKKPPAIEVSLNVNLPVIKKPKSDFWEKAKKQLQTYKSMPLHHSVDHSMDAAYYMAVASGRMMGKSHLQKVYDHCIGQELFVKSAERFSGYCTLNFQVGSTVSTATKTGKVVSIDSVTAGSDFPIKVRWNSYFVSCSFYTPQGIPYLSSDGHILNVIPAPSMNMGEKMKHNFKSLMEIAKAMETKYKITLPHRDMVDIFAISEEVTVSNPVGVVHVAVESIKDQQSETPQPKKTNETPQPKKTSETIGCYIIFHNIIIEKARLVGMPCVNNSIPSSLGNGRYFLPISGNQISAFTKWAKAVRAARWEKDDESIKETVKVNVHLLDI